MRPKVLLILALVFAAAILIPLRRARRAFPVRSQLSGITAQRLPLMRRRPGGPPAVLNSTAAARRNLARRLVTPDVGALAARRGVNVSKAGPTLGAFRVAAGSASLRHGPTVAAEHGGVDQIVDCVDRDIHLRPPGTPRPNPSTALAVRPAADVPVPPPKPSV